MINWPLMENNIDRSDIDCLVQFLNESDVFTQGKKVREFEQQWSKWLGTKHSLFVNSGSSANFITLAVLKELYGDGEVITSPIGWESDVASIMNAGLTPVFVDVDLANLAMNPENILGAITEQTKAVLLTHVLGFAGCNEMLIEELKHRNIILIEDCCESHGARLNGRKIGTLGQVSNFSFYYAHHMSTIEGGMICTDDDTFYQYARMYRSHGMLRECSDAVIKESLAGDSPDTYPEFTFMVPGFNMRSTELNAVIGLNQLLRLDSNNKARRENFAVFLKRLDSKKYFVEFAAEGSVNYAFVLLVKNGDRERFQRVIDTLRSEGVEFRRGTAGGGNLVRQPFVRKHMPELDPKEFPQAEYIHELGLYIGNYASLQKDKILALCERLNKL